MSIYYIIIQNWSEPLQELGEFKSIIEAEKYADENSDHLTHGEGWIVISKDDLIRLGLLIKRITGNGGAS